MKNSDMLIFQGIDTGKVLDTYTDNTYNSPKIDKI